MADTGSDAGFAQHAGRVLWPRTVADLTDTTRCPACHTSLGSVVCAACGLDLGHPAAVALLALSTDAATALEGRAALIGRIRFETNEARARAAAPVPAPVPTPLPAPVPTPVSTLDALPSRPDPHGEPPRLEAPQLPAPSPPAQPPAATAPATAPGRPKRSSVQLVLLIIGVLLVSVAAIFFLTVAWLFAGLAFRSTVTGLLTLAALATAAILRRKDLVTTAEGIGALGVVLVLLDAWALRQNNLFGLAAGDGLIYWGVALSVCTVLFLGWHALSRLRVASVAGFLVAAPAAGLLVAGLTAGQDDTLRLFLAVLGAAAGTLIHRATLPRAGSLWPSIDRVPERMILLAVGGFSLAVASVTAVSVAPETTLAPLWCLGAVAGVAVLHVLEVVSAAGGTGRRAGGARVYLAFAYGAAGLAAAAACTIAPVLAVREASVPLLLTAPVLVAVTLALSLEWLGRRGAGPARRAALTAAVTATAAAALCATIVVGFAVWPLGQAVATGLSGGGDPVAEPGADNGWALLSLVAVAALVSVFWALGRTLRARRLPVAGLCLAITLLAVPFAGSLGPVLALYLLLGAAALVALLLNGSGRLRLGSFRPLVVAALVAAQTLGYAVSWASSATWWIGSVSAVLVLCAARLLVDRANGAARGALLSGAIVLTLVIAGTAPWALTLGEQPSATATLVNVVAGLTLAAALLQLVLAVAGRRILGEVERGWAFWTLLLPTVLAFAAPVTTLRGALPSSERATLLQPEPAALIVHTALLGAAALVWVLRPGDRARSVPQRLVAAVALAPALLLLLRTVMTATSAPASLADVAVPVVALSVCGLALLVGTLHADRRVRAGLEAGALLGLVPAVVDAVGSGRGLGWLTLVLSGVVALLLAIAPDGLFASRSPRRHLGWLALLLGTAGLWLGLGRAGTAALEPYVLPVAGVLLVTAGLVRRFGRVDRSAAASPVAALLTLAGLLVALVPLAVAGQSGSLLRPVVAAGASAVLLLTACTLRFAPPRSAYLAAAGTAGAIGLLAAGAGRVGAVLAEPGAPDGRLEIWLLLPCAVAVTAAFRLAADPDAATRRAREAASVALTVVSLGAVLLAETQAFDGGWRLADSALTPVRATALVLVLSAVHVLARWRPRAPLGAATAVVAITFAGIGSLAALSVGATDPFELVTVPVGLALVAGQVLAGRGVEGSAPDDRVVAGRSRAVPAPLVPTSVGLAIALLPSSVEAADGSLLRPILVLGVGSTLAVAGALLTRRPRWRALAWPACVVGVLAIVLTAGGRVIGLLESAPFGPDLRLEAWLLPAALLVAVAGAGIIAAWGGEAEAAETEGGASAVAATRFGCALVVSAILGVLVAVVTALDFAPLAAIRVIASVWLFSALHLAAFWVDRGRPARVVSWVAIGAGALVVLAGYAHAAPHPIEIVTVPLAIALLASGWLHLGSTPGTRSWPWCAPGLLVLLGPSLLLDLTESPLWRVVGLGVLATAVVVIGAARRLQAPFVIGATVLLVHGLAQLWPWISLAFGAVPWWLWLGAGGILLIVLAARYEQRIHNFKTVALKISALR